jgi:hypothetical protein
MAFGGDVDTLALMFDKLQYIFRGFDPYIQSFAEMHELYKQGKLSEREFYHSITDSVFKYSALEFLGLKALFEIKKSLNRMNNTSSVPLMSTGLISENLMGETSSRHPNSLSSFITAKSLPSRDGLMQKVSANEKRCASCGKTIPLMAKYCTICGNKI